MGGHSKRACSDYSSPPPTPPTPDLIVTGEGINPDCRGNYFQSTPTPEFSERYIRQDGLFMIVNQVVGGSCGILSLSVPLYEHTWWKFDTENVIGVYEPGDEAIGSPIVSAGT